jgi:geranylgeranyl pyrophosphate synthase
MDRLEPGPNQPLEKTVLDWLINSWFAKEKKSSYRDGLISVIKSLWPERDAKTGRGGKPSFLPLPSLCCHALGLFSPKVYALNAAWALFYAASYLLDKIEDQEIDHPIFAAYGIGGTANLTTGLILNAERILSEMGPDERVNQATIEAVRIAFNQRVLDVCSGQHMDLTIQEPRLNEAWKIIDGKSGKFFALGSFIGARLATDDAEIIENFSQFGQRLGILIQITNDINGLGKENQKDNDLASGKRTLPVIYALEVLPTEEQDRLRGLLINAPEDRSAESEARKIIISAGAIFYLSLEADKHREQAKTALSRACSNLEYIPNLQRLLDYAITTKEYYRRYRPKPAK